MRAIGILVFATALACAVASTAAARRPLPERARVSCAPTDDHIAKHLHSRLQRAATSDDSVYIALRRSQLGDMPRLTPAEVQPVSDEALCDRAALAVDSAFFGGVRSGFPVYLVRMGSRYGALAKTPDEEGHLHSIAFTDSSFRVLSKMLF
jgi:CTP:molybdopterin cytidylyltransferase MocA